MAARGRRFAAWLSGMAVALMWSVIVVPTASADKIINGCTIVDNPTLTRFTTCQGADLFEAPWVSRTWRAPAYSAPT